MKSICFVIFLFLPLFHNNAKIYEYYYFSDILWVSGLDVFDVSTARETCEMTGEDLIITGDRVREIEFDDNTLRLRVREDKMLVNLHNFDPPMFGTRYWQISGKFDGRVFVIYGVTCEGTSCTTRFKYGSVALLLLISFPLGVFFMCMKLFKKRCALN